MHVCKLSRSKVWICARTKRKGRPCGRPFLLVGVKGLKPSTSRSQTERAINCATPRQGGVNLRIIARLLLWRQR
jgi:hypothetical protein